MTGPRRLRAALLHAGCAALLTTVAVGVVAASGATLAAVPLLVFLAGVPLWWLLTSAGAARGRADAAGSPPPAQVAPVSPAGPTPDEVLARIEATRLEIVRQQRELQLLAERDPLTGCLNRLAFAERLDRIAAEARRTGEALSVAVVGIDGFGAVAAALGQEAVDRVLGLAAQVMRENLRDRDLLGRWESGSFCVALPGIPADVGTLIVERIRKAIAEGASDRFTAGTEIGVSAGLAAPDERPDAAGLCDLAAQALAEAAASGGGRTLRWRSGMASSALAPEDSPARAPEALLPGLDPLTGLPLSPRFRERLGQELEAARRSGKSVAAVVLGLSLAELTDLARAEPSVQEIRLQLGLRLKHSLRVIDVVGLLDEERELPGRGALLAAYGALVTELPDPRMAANVVRRICGQLGEPLEVGGERIGLRVDAGVAIGPGEADAIALLASASAALDDARERPGRVSCRFAAEEMNQVYVDHERLRAELEQALAEDQLELHYLPRLDLGTGRVTALEALVRWNHPGRGLLQPAQFLQAAETSGMIVPLGNWVLARAVAQAAAWQRSGHRGLVVCVNLSRFQLRQINLVDNALSLLAASGLDPSRLELEIAEASVLQNTEAAVALINRLNRAGVRVAIDDFGTGYAVLKYLRRFPADVVKIDRALVAGVQDDNRDATIVSAIVSLAHSLGIETVAEGVETALQRSALRSLGCRSGQGFLFGRPLPAGDVESWLERNRHEPA